MWLNKVTEVLSFRLKKMWGVAPDRWKAKFRAQHLDGCGHARRGVELKRAEFCLT